MMREFIVTPNKTVYSVAQLNREARQLLEGHFPLISVSGEISNLVLAASGHRYFTLKDENAQIRCALFRNRSQHIAAPLDNGMQVLAEAKLSLYEGRGDYQLIVESIEPSGEGALQLAFEKRKRELAARGLFDETHKKPLPDYISTLGVITSSTGAALHDVLSTLKRRFPAITVIIYPTMVQGTTAAQQIATQIARANQRHECDCLILTRGGGSLEDLWPFNEEIVAQQIFDSKLPIISAVGHEIDFTIADFVADIRAPTPTAAAELASPDQRDYLQTLMHRRQQLIRQIQWIIQQHYQHLDHLSKRLRHPGQALLEQKQRLDQLEMHLQLSMNHRLQNKVLTFLTLKQRLAACVPAPLISELNRKLENMKLRLTTVIQRLLQTHNSELRLLIQGIHNLNPHATLKRGYAIVKKDAKIIRSKDDVENGNNIQVVMHDGDIIAKVLSSS